MIKQNRKRKEYTWIIHKPDNRHTNNQEFIWCKGEFAMVDLILINFKKLKYSKDFNSCNIHLSRKYVLSYLKKFYEMYWLNDHRLYQWGYIVTVFGLLGAMVFCL